MSRLCIRLRLLVPLKLPPPPPSPYLPQNLAVTNLHSWLVLLAAWCRLLRTACSHPESSRHLARYSPPRLTPRSHGCSSQHSPLKTGIISNCYVKLCFTTLSRTREYENTRIREQYCTFNKSYANPENSSWQTCYNKLCFLTIVEY